MKLPSLPNLRLAQKLMVLLGTIFLIGAVISGIFVAVVVDNTAKQEISAKGMMLIATMNSARDYTNAQIEPKIREQSSREFLSETIPAFTAHTIFQNLRKNPEYQEFIYRETALNPTNIADRADIFEKQLIERFRSTPDLLEQTGFTNTSSGGKIFYIARPTRIVKQSCLQCHGSPQNAPKSMIAKYGDKNGFNWKLNDIVGAQIVSVPADQILTNAKQLFFSIMGLILSIFGVTIGMVSIWLRRQVVKPVTTIARMVEAISLGETSARLDSDRQDEIGLLAHAIDRLSVSLEIAMRRIRTPIK